MSMTMMPIIRAIFAEALLAFDAVVLFSILFALLHPAAGGRAFLPPAAAALFLQLSPVGHSLFFILFEAFTAVNLWFIALWGWTPFVVFGTVHLPVVLWIAGGALRPAFLLVQYLRLRRELAWLPDFRDAEEIAAGRARAVLPLSVTIAILCGMTNTHNITEAEWPIMRVLWTNGSATAAEIVDAVTGERDVAMRTVKTLLRRLVAKKAVAYAIDPDDSRVYHYRAVVKKDEAVRTKNSNFLAHFYQNNIGELLARFVGDAPLTDDQILELQKILDEKKRRRGKK